MANLGKPAYQGRPDPIIVPNRIMLIAVILLVLGFLRAAYKNGWLEPVIEFILS